MNLRSLKKLIDFEISAVIEDCAIYMSLFPASENLETASNIIDQAVELDNNLRYRANHCPEVRNSKAVRAYYNAILNELYEGVDTMSEKLSSTISSK